MLVRWAGDEAMSYLEREGACWESLDIYVDLYGEVYAENTSGEYLDTSLYPLSIDATISVSGEDSLLVP